MTVPCPVSSCGLPEDERRPRGTQSRCRPCRTRLPDRYSLGEDVDFDLILIRDESLERVQVKYTESNGLWIVVRAQSHSLTNGKVRRTKRYTAATIDWIAVYDKSTDRCYYVPAGELGVDGVSGLRLRISTPLNNQRIGIRWASDYLNPEIRYPSMEPAGLEPATSSVQGTRSPN